MAVAARFELVNVEHAGLKFDVLVIALCEVRVRAQGMSHRGNTKNQRNQGQSR